jgi:hypothetical protein
MFSEMIGAVCIEKREQKNKQCGQKEGIFNMQQVLISPTYFPLYCV